MSDEHIVTAQIKLEASKYKMKLFRNNRGMFLTLDGQRRTRAGLELDGSGDLIGWTQVVITPDMVGRTVAVFTSIEVKESNWVKPKNDREKKQNQVANKIVEQGGIAAIINDSKKIKKTLDDFKKI